MTYKDSIRPFLKRITITKEKSIDVYIDEDIWDEGRYFVIGDVYRCNWVQAFIPYGFLISIEEIKNPYLDNE